ncbi:MAG: leucine-rich repeat domain-containing protein [Saprospiraceae bacterium]|nr:leucine-rich repeat domain-containing protein [Saprospiraceae bacterium]
MNIPFPSQFGNLRKLKELHLCTTGLTGTIPTSMGTLDSLGNLDICQNNLTGSVPANLATRSKLQVFQIEENKFDVLPDFSALPFAAFNSRWTNFFSVQNNRFTFEDIVPNMPIINRIASTYALQDSIFVDTTIRGTQNTPLSIDLKIDAAISSNVYNWYKNGAFYRTINGVNKLVFNSLQTTDAGTYEVKVTNPNAPLLTLNSRKITVVVQPNNSCRYQDSLALITFYNNFNGNNWRIRTNWLSNRPINEWYGITLNTEGCVETIKLVADSLRGNMYDLNFSKLTILDVSENRISGQLPNFRNVPMVEKLFFYSNQLTGTLPSFNLPNLTILHVGRNALSGTLPNLNLPNLTYLYLYDNQFSGVLPNFNLPRLEVLSIKSNQLTDVIPNFDLPNLRRLDLHANQLNGTIPDFRLPNLQYLDLAFNQLRGSLPTFQNLARLHILYLNNNQLTGCFPTEWQRFCRLRFSTNPNIYPDSSYNITNNPQLTWQGDFRRFCNNESPIGTSCNDSLSYTINDKIQADCSCRGLDTNSCRYRDSVALVEFFIATNGNNWLRKDNWLTSAPISTWYGVCADAAGCVTSLDFDGVSDCYGRPFGGNRIVATAFPDALFRLLDIEFISFSSNPTSPTKNGLGSTLPNAIGRLTKLKELQLANCGITTLSDSVWTLPNLEGLVLDNNPLNQVLSNKISGLKKVLRLHFQNCQLKGAMPDSIANLSNLRFLDLQDNQVDSFPDISRLPLTAQRLPYFFLQNNKLTFDDLLKNRNHFVYDSFLYAPQQLIFKDTTINATIGSTITVDLKIDGAIPNNNYRWFKNGVEVPSLLSQKNTLILKGVTSCDAGTYTVEVTNPNATLLTLKSRIITLVVNPNAPQTRNKTICYGQKDTLPSGQIVAPTNSATYRETLRNRANTCDSVTITTNLTVTPLQTIGKIDSFCQGGSYNLPQTNRNVTLAGVYEDTITATNGCKTRYATTLTYRKVLTQTVNASICKGETYRLPDNTSVTTAGTYTNRKVSTTGCDTVITTQLSIRPSVEAFDEEITVDIGDSATINLLTNDKLSSYGGRFTVIKSPTDGTWRRLTDSLIHYKAPQVLRGLTQQVLEYKVCMNGCINNCDSATLRITLKDLDAPLGRIKNGVATNMTGEEFFEIDSLAAYPQAQLFIYNNWNELVFKSAIPYNNLWSGTDQREAPLPSGVYYYVLRHAAPNRKLLDGQILLLR